MNQNRQDRPGKDQILPLCRQHLQADAEAGKNEREFADLGEARRHSESRFMGMAKGADDSISCDRFADDDDKNRNQHRTWPLNENSRSEERTVGKECGSTCRMRWAMEEKKRK